MDEGRRSTLARRIGVIGASFVGISAMVGSGVFFVWAPAAAAAGTWLLAGLVIAAAIATLNALTTAQLAMAYPRSGGVYTFAGETVHHWAGFAAGWLFLTGKIASAGASALIAGLYLWPAAAKWVAIGVVVVLAVVNATGIRSTVAASAVLVAVVLVGLAITVVFGLGAATPQRLGSGDVSPLGVLQAAGLIFFGFAGYARIATLGEEVVEPRKTIPRAVVIALSVTFLLYAAVAVTCLVVLGPTALAASDAPLADLVSGPWSVVVPVLAAIAAIGSLLGVLAGLSRTGLAMARGGDLPAPLGRVADRTRTPVVAELVIAGGCAPGRGAARPARAGRFLRVRRARLLRDRAPGGVPAACRGALAATSCASRRGGGVHRARRHSALAGCARYRDAARARSGGPVDRASSQIRLKRRPARRCAWVGAQPELRAQWLEPSVSISVRSPDHSVWKVPGLSARW